MHKRESLQGALYCSGLIDKAVNLSFPDLGMSQIGK
jgi:hypothetical protein